MPSWRDIEFYDAQCCCCWQPQVRCALFIPIQDIIMGPVCYICYECLTAVQLALRDALTPAKTDEI